MDRCNFKGKNKHYKYNYSREKELIYLYCIHKCKIPKQGNSQVTKKWCKKKEEERKGIKRREEKRAQKVVWKEFRDDSRNNKIDCFGLIVLVISYPDLTLSYADVGTRSFFFWNTNMAAVTSCENAP